MKIIKAFLLFALLLTAGCFVSMFICCINNNEKEDIRLLELENSIHNSKGHQELGDGAYEYSLDFSNDSVWLYDDDYLVRCGSIDSIVIFLQEDNL